MLLVLSDGVGWCSSAADLVVRSYIPFMSVVKQKHIWCVHVFFPTGTTGTGNFLYISLWVQVVLPPLPNSPCMDPPSWRIIGILSLPSLLPRWNGKWSQQGNPRRMLIVNCMHLALRTLQVSFVQRLILLYPVSLHKERQYALDVSIYSNGMCLLLVIYPRWIPDG